MFWQLQSYPRCRHHVFLSHCWEDHDDLVRPVYDGLAAAGILPWLDREDYYYGRPSRAALRDAVLLCRHVVFFVTPAMLASGRGWCAFELAFAELAEGTLVWSSGQLANLILPLYFVPPDDPTLPRTVWQHPRDRGRFHAPAADGDRAAWAVREVARFLRDEQARHADLAVLARQDSAFRKELRRQPGRFARIIGFDPGPV